ncbi:(d)CMP kinase [Parvularcula marina]|uniref:Cytidylate kinase n=1 Tax=Parvularcula marina TaxID=2292771 RepID=A0A371RLQ4_9PROT|nr:(d)CMP kinase [Parvularcula marina]
MVIAVDGPAASGKGTLSRRLCTYYGLSYLDTGILYRGVGWILLSQNLDPRHEEDAARVARAFSLDQIDGADIRTPDVSRASSIVAAQPEVRAALLEFQRDFAAHPPKGSNGVVLDGRDIGTVVCPDALVKLYISASPEERAKRRWLELEKRDNAMGLDAVLEDIRRRDARDSGRATAPMRPATDAHFIDTTTLDADAVFARACRHIDQALGVSGAVPASN